MKSHLDDMMNEPGMSTLIDAERINDQAQQSHEQEEHKSFEQHFAEMGSFARARMVDKARKVVKKRGRMVRAIEREKNGKYRFQSKVRNPAKKS